jgi:Putative zinc-finger
LDHEQAATRITDWVSERLSPAEAERVAEHVRSCVSCTAAAEAARALRVAARETGPRTPHLDSVTLARYTLTPADLTVTEIAGCRAHLDECPDCARERDLVRAANAPSWTRALAAWLAGAPEPRALLAPALAVIAVLLAVPAYQGLVTLPRERARHEASVVATPAVPVMHPSAWAGGGVETLMLEPATRGVTTTPVVRLRPGQPAEPILFACDRPPGDSVTVRLTGTHDAVVWTHVTAVSEIWSAGHHVVSLLVPADALSPGEYRLELLSAPDQGLHASARFRVEPSAAVGR